MGAAIPATIRLELPAESAPGNVCPNPHPASRHASRSSPDMARYARLSVSARNLFTVSPYEGLDPEVSNFGRQAAGAGLEIGPFPPSRSYWFTVDLGF